MHKVIEIINQHIPEECKGHATQSQCAGCSKLFKTAAIMVESSAESGLSEADAIASCLDHLAYEMPCTGGDKAREKLGMNIKPGQLPETNRELETQE